METKTAVIGDRGSILAFKITGMDVFEAETEHQLASLIESLAEDGYAIIFITEDLASKSRSITDRYEDKILPAIIPVPGRGGSTGEGIKRVHENVERAIGTDIFKQKN